MHEKLRQRSVSNAIRHVGRIQVGIEDYWGSGAYGSSNCYFKAPDAQPEGRVDVYYVADWLGDLVSTIEKHYVAKAEAKAGMKGHFRAKRRRLTNA